MNPDPTPQLPPVLPLKTGPCTDKYCNSLIASGDEVENDEVRFFADLTAGYLVAIDKTKAWTLKDESSKMAECIRQGNYACHPMKLTFAEPIALANGIGAKIPDGLPDLPLLPKGYDSWVYRGKGWRTDRFKKIDLYAAWWPKSEVWSFFYDTHPSGDEKIHYIEAVKALATAPVIQPTSDPCESEAKPEESSPPTESKTVAETFGKRLVADGPKLEPLPAAHYCETHQYTPAPNDPMKLCPECEFSAEEAKPEAEGEIRKLNRKEEYFLESLDLALEEIAPDVILSQYQRYELAHAITESASMQSEYFGDFNIPNPSVERAEKAEKELETERRKLFCRECNGSGRIRTNGPYHGSDSQCWKCHGEGKHLP